MSEKKESLKAVKIQLIPENKSIYAMLRKIRKRYHHEIRRAKIALAWRIALKPDKDGHLVLGMCHKTSDLMKEFADYDFVILLNKEVWNDEKFDKKKKYALLDHELCHAAPSYDKYAKHKKDERGRYVYRSRHHDVEEFHCIVKRHGVWKRDLEVFAEALLRNKHRKEK